MNLYTFCFYNGHHRVYVGTTGHNSREAEDKARMDATLPRLMWTLLSMQRTLPR